MATFIFASIIVVLSILGLSLGLILNNKPLQGSCGGMNNLDSDIECGICGGNPNKCSK
tara:strand:+ start:450 stop:623 length:174 start_codon:yes stop_codon:yes gene_type:complete